MQTVEWRICPGLHGQYNSHLNINCNLKFSPSFALVTFLLNSHMWLPATILDSVDRYTALPIPCQVPLDSVAGGRKRDMIRKEGLTVHYR
jgi:hypothetical protein